MALSDFTNPPNPWKIKDVTEPSHCKKDELITFTITLTCSHGHSITGGVYNPASDSITFDKVCTITREVTGPHTEITCDFNNHPPVVTGSWTADDSGNTGDGE